MDMPENALQTLQGHLKAMLHSRKQAFAERLDGDTRGSGAACVSGANCMDFAQSVVDLEARIDAIDDMLLESASSTRVGTRSRNSRSEN